MHWLTRLSTESTSTLKKVCTGTDCCDLHTMLVGLLLVIGNGLGTVPLYVLTTRVELTPESSEPSFDNEVQDIPKWQTRCTKINSPSVDFVQSQFVRKISERIDLLLNCLCTTVSAKNEGIFAPKLDETSRFSNLIVKNMWGYAGGLEKPWHMSQGLVAT